MKLNCYPLSRLGLAELARRMSTVGPPGERVVRRHVLRAELLCALVAASRVRRVSPAMIYVRLYTYVTHFTTTTRLACLQDHTPHTASARERAMLDAAHVPMPKREGRTARTSIWGVGQYTVSTYQRVCTRPLSTQGQPQRRRAMQHCPVPMTRMWRQTFSTTTAVPYAKISEAPAATELEVILTPTIAFAPRSAACLFMRSVASARASRSKSV